jgi:hypothetical protein
MTRSVDSPGREGLTPDKETGLGDWTTEQIIAAITKGLKVMNAIELFLRLCFV